MQAISNSKQNFTGNALKLGEFSHITSNNVDKALPKLRNPAELYIEAAKQVIHDYTKQYIKPGNLFERMLDKLTGFVK